MSTIIMSACWDLQMPPTAKAVLISLADNANDSGYCWPSLAAISRRTCFSRTAVIEAIKWLEAEGYLHADRSDRYRTTYVVNQVKATEKQGQRKARNQSAKQTSTAGVLVRQTNDEVREPDNEVRQPDTNRQEPSRTKSIKSMTPSPSAPALPDWIDPAAWAGFAEMRKRIRAPLTERALELTIKELARFRADGTDPNDILDQSTRNGWRGVFPIKGDFQRGPPGGRQPMGKQMQGVMALEELKNGARERQRLAAGGSCDGTAEALLPLAGPDARR